MCVDGEEKGEGWCREGGSVYTAFLLFTFFGV